MSPEARTKLRVRMIAETERFLNVRLHRSTRTKGSKMDYNSERNNPNEGPPTRAPRRRTDIKRGPN